MMEKVNSDTTAPERVKLEVCVDSIESAMAAALGGAFRVELCDYLTGGGTTPSAGMIEIVRKNIDIGLHILIRPRRGDFLYSDHEFNIMKKDIEICRNLGADGVVIGLLLSNGTIDLERTEELVSLAGPMSVTFHRAFDLTPDPEEALEDLLKLKIDRLLTSGQQATAMQGVELIRKLKEQADGKMIIMPGGGVNEENVRTIITRTGVSEIHASVRSRVDGKMEYRKELPPMSKFRSISEYEHVVADLVRIREFQKVYI